MANLSDLTRKNQVLTHLRLHMNQWVAGPELANEQVGGSEGLKRLRELRQEGHDIRMRKHPHPDRDVWEYMLTKATTWPSSEAAQNRMHGLWSGPSRDIDLQPTTAQQIEPAEKPVYPRFDPSGRPKIGDAIVKREDGTFEYVPPSRPLQQLTTPPDPPQPPGIKFTRMPEKLDFGTMAVCHRCKGRKSGEHLSPRTGKVIPADEFCRDPEKRKEPCRRCNGFGVVPNQGPIPLTVPDGME